ncbi:N-acetylmuramoyl-L-alanine amidase [Paenibacillus sp. 1011MAR3C5]|uniref:N-acetylmuramoyl-L-alanine amidase n=1 Tax=Paenibacillus sp. 1011MAR3C5 TaxID=1675787 RepID=UPI000E6D08F3|nr:N-acetylmuramoyl-L-alanine amidase [Paenibacillus sp. 1011MAR3C5]RJE84265.1 N-acetylmuramoyl-L-alanine amidase [Paenibacillus sp. 1011MAR3C5]
MKPIGVLKPELIIDPGHGGSDPGASGNGIVEKAMNLDISLYQFQRFKELGIKVALTRNSDITLASSVRTELVKNSGAKYCISNHINAAPSSAAAGAETIYSVYSDGKLANTLLNALKDAGQPSRRAFSRSNESGGDYYFMHRLTGDVATVIVEYGFCTNSTDADRLRQHWKKYAEAVVEGYCRFAGHPYSPPKTAPVKTGPSLPAEPSQTEGFTDIQGHWAEASIRKASLAGLLNGVTPGRFAPEEPLTRAQAAVLLDRLGLLEKGGIAYD